MENGNARIIQSTKNETTRVNLPFDPLEFPRETHQHYISANDFEINEMLSSLGLGELITNEGSLMV